MQRKKILFIVGNSPYNQFSSQEKVEYILTTLAFEQDVSVVFADNGIYQLVSHQRAETIARKDLSKMLLLLDHYDIKSLYVHTQSLKQSGLTLSDLILPLHEINDAELAHLMAQQNIIVG